MKTKFSFKYLIPAIMAICIIALCSCSENNEVVSTNHYGYIQLKLYKQSKRTILEGSELQHLGDAKKIEISLVNNGRSIKQTLNLNSSGTNGNEFVLTAENLKLTAGQYTIVGYVIYGGYKEGSMAEILHIGTPDEGNSFTIEPNHITTHAL